MKKDLDFILLIYLTAVLVLFALFPLFSKADIGTVHSFSMSGSPAAASFSLTETWDGATSCASSSGSYTCDNAWTATSGSGVLSFDATAPALTGFSGQSATLTTTGWQEAYGEIAITPQSSLYGRVIVNAANIADAARPTVLTLRSSGCSSVVASVKVGYDTVEGYRLYLAVASTEVDYKDISANTAYRVEFFIDNVANTWEWRVDGVSEGSGSADPANDAACVRVGGYGGDLDLDFDNIALSSSGWIGAP